MLWVYRNAPHDVTKEKTSFLMFGVNLRSPTEAALLPPDSVEPSDVADYRRELIPSLSSARDLAVGNIKKGQESSKKCYGLKSRVTNFDIGDWVLVRFPQDESRRNHKMSKPWHCPYRFMEKNDPYMTVVPIYFPESGKIQIHLSRVCLCPPKWPDGFYWYSGRL